MIDFFKKHKFVMLGVAMGLSLSAASESHAFAGLGATNPPPIAPQTVASEAGLIQLAGGQGERRRGRNWDRWDRRYHGDRCRTRYGNCRYYRDGYYYRTPWWTLPAIIGGAAIGAAINDDYDEPAYVGRRGSRHVAWCSDRYRSYNIRTNTWISNSGDVRECNSPYN
jgi:BA14K-like protein